MRGIGLWSNSQDDSTKDTITGWALVRADVHTDIAYAAVVVASVLNDFSVFFCVVLPVVSASARLADRPGVRV